MAASGSRARSGGGSRRVEEREPILTLWPYVESFGRGFGKPAPVKDRGRRAVKEREPMVPWARRHARDFALGFGKAPAIPDREAAVSWTGRKLRAGDERLRGIAWWITPLLTFVAGVVIIIGTYVRYDEGDPEPLSAIDGFEAFYMTLGVGLLLIAALLIARRGRSVMVGAVGLLALTLLTLTEFVSEVVFALQKSNYDPAAGFYLQETGFILMILAAAIVTNAMLRPLFARSEWALRDRTRIGTIAAGFGFATAVGYSMNPIADRFDSFGSPIDPFFPFDASTQIVALIALATIPLLAVATRHWAVAVGLTIGFAIFGLARNLGNFFGAYEESGTKAVEGTWTFLAASLASLLVLVYSIALPRGQAPPAPARRSAAQRPVAWAAGLAFFASLFMFASLFPRYDDFRFSIGTDGPSGMLTLVIAAGFATAGAFLLQRGRALVGAVMLGTIVLLFLPFPVQELLGLDERGNGGVGMGFVFDKIAFGAAAAGAVLALWNLRRTERRDAGFELSGWALLALLLGVMTAIATGLNFERFFGGAGGSPFLNYYDFRAYGPSSRIIWASVLVIVALPVIALVAMTASRSIATGLFFGLATFVLGGSVFRLAESYYNGQMHDAEGTWLFVSAAPALVAVLGYHLFVRNLGANRATRR